MLRSHPILPVLLVLIIQGSAAPVTEKPSTKLSEVTTISSSTEPSREPTLEPSEESSSKKPTEDFSGEESGEGEITLEPSEEPSSRKPTEDFSGESSGQSSGGGEINVEPSSKPSEGPAERTSDGAEITIPTGEPRPEISLEPEDFSIILPEKVKNHKRIKASRQPQHRSGNNRITGK